MQPHEYGTGLAPKQRYEVSPRPAKCIVNAVLGFLLVRCCPMLPGALLPTVAVLDTTAYSDPPQQPAAVTSSRVTLRGEMSLADALTALHKQTANRVVDLRAPLGELPEKLARLRLDLQNVPFWQALTEILQQSVTRPVPTAGGEAIGLRARSGGLAPLSWSGPFAALATKVVAVHDLEAPERSHLELTVQLFWEPRLRALLLQAPADSVRARAGTALVGGPRGAGAARLASELGREIQIRLPLPARPLDSLQDVTVRWQALVSPGTLAVKMPVAAGSLVQDGVTIELAPSPARAGRPLTLAWTLRYPPGVVDPESHQVWMFQSECFLEKQGQRWPVDKDRHFISIVEGQAIRLTYYVSDGPNSLSDCYAILLAPQPFVQVPICFHFASIPLP
ncbi:MAG: hypothetical protein C4296_09530 [Gemmataceae bacterium]